MYTKIHVPGCPFILHFLIILAVDVKMTRLSPIGHSNIILQDLCLQMTVSTRTKETNSLVITSGVDKH